MAATTMTVASGELISMEVTESVRKDRDVLWQQLSKSQLLVGRLPGLVITSPQGRSRANVKVAFGGRDWLFHMFLDEVDHDLYGVSIRGRGREGGGFGTLEVKARLSLVSEGELVNLKLVADLRVLGSGLTGPEVGNLVSAAVRQVARNLSRDLESGEMSKPYGRSPVSSIPVLRNILIRKLVEMKIVNSFSVRVPIDEVWTELLDLERVAGYLPGASVRAAGEEGEFLGSMKVKVGPVVTAYDGKVRLGRVDDSEHVAVLHIEAQEERGQGTASAVITNRAVSDGEITTVNVETVLTVTGRQAQFGRGIMNSVADKMLGQFAKRFEQGLLAGAGYPAGNVGPVVGESSDDDAMDVGSALVGLPTILAAGVAVMTIVTLAVYLLRRSPD